MPASPADGDLYAHQVARLVDDLEATLLRLLSTLLAKDTKTETRTWAIERLAELQWLKTKAQRATAETMAMVEREIREAILAAYNHGTATAVHDLDRAGYDFTPGGLPATTTALNLATEPTIMVRRAAAMVPEILGAAYQQAIAAAATEVLGGGSTRLQAAQRVLDRLLSDGIRGFTDARGRRWSLDTYVEMAVRSTTGQAAVAGHVAQLQAVGVDLVEVSDSPRECPLCLIPGTIVEGPAPTGRARSEYTGNVVSITTASGKHLTGTPDHPVLTPRGWVRLKDLHPGDEVVSNTGEHDISRVMPNDIQVPTRIEVAGEGVLPLLLAGPTRRDLDDHWSYREIRAVLPHAGLLGKTDASFIEPLRQLLLIGRVGTTAPLLGPYDTSLGLVRPGLAAAGGVGRRSHGLALLGSGGLPAFSHDVGALGRQDVGVHLAQSALNAVMTGPCLNASASKIVGHYPTADAEGGAELLRALSGHVAFDEVIGLSIRQFSGHVWDLSTEPSWFLANGIVTHNCRPWEGKVLSLSGRVGAVIVPSVTDGESVTVKVAGTLAEAKRAGLQHPNCTHRVTAFLPGATKPIAAQADSRGYDEKQQQRSLERKVREWKRREALALTDDARTTARRKVRYWQGRIRAHVDEHDLKRLRYREQAGSAVAPLAH